MSWTVSLKLHVSAIVAIVDGYSNLVASHEILIRIYFRVCTVAAKNEDNVRIIGNINNNNSRSRSGSNNNNNQDRCI